MALATPTASEVRLTITTTLSDDAVAQFVDDAVLIAEQCSSIATFSESKQKAIIRYLAAHLIAMNDASARKISESMGDASESFSTPVLGDALRGTTYGQQAITLDSSGCLAKVGKTPVTFKVL